MATEKTAYHERVQPYLSQITDWIASGMPERNIYQNLSVSSASWTKYKHQQAELQRAIKDGKDFAIHFAEQQLVNLVAGYTETQETWERVWDDRKGCFIEARTARKVTKKAPSMEALRFFLTNKAGANWKNRQETSVQSDSLESMLKGMSDAELKRLDAKLDAEGDD